MIRSTSVKLRKSITRHIDNRLARIGMTIPILIIAAVSNDAQLIHGPAHHNHVQKLDAIRWATAVVTDAYERTMPSATSGSVRNPECRITTLRSKGSHDNLDFAIRIVELCDHSVRGVVITPEAEPMTNQLARSKLEQPGIQPSDAISRLRLRQMPLKAKVIRKILDQLARVHVPVLAPQEMFLDARVMEVSSNSGGAKSAIQVSGAAGDGGGAPILLISELALKSVGIKKGDLLVDVSYWSTDDQ